MKTYKINIPNCPGDFEDNIDWNLYKNSKRESNWHTIIVKEQNVLDMQGNNYPVTSLGFKILNFGGTGV